MLVLSRKSAERISIGENITIEVRRIAGNRVTLAIDAPRDIRILRGELESAAKEFESPRERQDPSTANNETQSSEAPPPEAEDDREETYRVAHYRAPLSKALHTTASHAAGSPSAIG